MILVEYLYESLYYRQQLYYPAIQGEPATQAKALRNCGTTPARRRYDYQMSDIFFKELYIPCQISTMTQELGDGMNGDL
jgi:hypothetical protein